MRDHEKRAALVMVAVVLLYMAAMIWLGVANGTGCAMPYHWSAGA